MPATRKTKVFISHATEDKADVAEPLVEALKKVGYETWYDRDILTGGDSILRGISNGIKEADYAVVIFSMAFFQKKWTMEEVNAFYALETVNKKIILPVWKGIEKADVRQYAPMFLDRLAFKWSDGIDSVVEGIGRAIDLVARVETFNPLEGIKERLTRAADIRNEAANSERLLKSPEGTVIVRSAAKEAFDKIEAAIADMEELEYKLRTIRRASSAEFAPILRIAGAFDIDGELRFEGIARNGLFECKLGLTLRKAVKDRYGEFVSSRKLYSQEWRPFVTASGNLLWLGNTNVSNEGLSEMFLNLLVAEVEKEALKGQPRR